MKTPDPFKDPIGHHIVAGGGPPLLKSEYEEKRPDLRPGFGPVWCDGDDEWDDEDELDDDDFVTSLDLEREIDDSHQAITNELSRLIDLAWTLEPCDEGEMLLSRARRVLARLGQFDWTGAVNRDIY